MLPTEFLPEARPGLMHSAITQPWEHELSEATSVAMPPSGPSFSGLLAPQAGCSAT